MVDLLNLSVISEDISFEGNLTLNAPLRVRGRIKGEIHASEKGKLIIEEMGSVEGLFQGHEIIVRGVFKGKIRSQGCVTLESTSSVIGEIEAKSLKVLPGAKLISKTNTKDYK
jgi:cytoskeletal protein CcmA (bactofilin family)